MAESAGRRPLNIVVFGASGRMGKMLIRAVDEADGMVLTGVTERPGHDWIGRDLGAAMGAAARDLIVSEDPLAALTGADAALDFTLPDATITHASSAADAGVAHIIGATGHSAEQLSAIAIHGGQIPIVRAGNMSLGVNLLTALTKKVAAALDESFDIEIVDTHHNQKVDAPSGTALMLGEAAAEGRGITLADQTESGRDGITGARAKGAIGFAALRGGDVVGEHDVIFAGAGERVILRHIATDRTLFARGAIRAARWATGQKPGLYSMMDVLGL